MLGLSLPKILDISQEDWNINYNLRVTKGSAIHFRDGDLVDKYLTNDPQLYNDLWYSHNKDRSGKVYFNWNRTYTVALITDKDNKTNHFVGVFKLRDCDNPEKLVTLANGQEHWVFDVEPVTQFEEYAFRLAFHHDRGSGYTGSKLTKHAYDYILKDIHEDGGIGKFPEYDAINISWARLNQIITSNNSSWKGALAHQAGIYLITDTLSGKMYVGSAYGKESIWGRWYHYATDGHGGNKLLKEVVVHNGLDYIKNYFRYSILQTVPKHFDKDLVIARENHWKEILLTRKFGYNDN